MLDLNKLKLHSLTITELMARFGITRKQAASFHSAVMADYDSICQQVPVYYN